MFCSLANDCKIENFVLMAGRLSCFALLSPLLLLYTASSVQAQPQDNGIVFTNAQYDERKNTYKYEVPINQNDVVNQTILTVECENRQNSRAVITYSIHSTEYFIIDPNTGQVVLAVDGQTLEHGTTYSTQILCSSESTSTIGATSRRQASLNIDYNIENEFPPIFIPSTLVERSYIEGNDISGENGVILDFNATDADRGVCGVISFSIGSANTDLFQIDSTTGVLSFVRPLDFEGGDQHTIIVTAQNTHQLCSSSTPPLSWARRNVDIRVTDINDTPPQFNASVYKVSIQEELETTEPRFIVSVPCIDQDTNSYLRYSLGDSHSGLFEINSNGEVSVTREIDYEANPSFLLSVTCRDEDAGEEQVDTATINVTVLPVNEYRPVIRPSLLTLSISEATLPGTKLVSPVSGSNAIKSYSVTDRDNGQHHSSYYFIMVIDPPQYGENFALDHRLGELTVRESFEKTHCGQDDKISARIDIRITVCDIDDFETCDILVMYLHVLALDCTAHFKLQRVNVSVSEFTPTGTAILSLPCQDFSNTTEKDVVLFSRDKDATDDVQIFSYEQQFGTLVLKQSLDYETQQTYTLDLFCTNSYNTTASAHVVVEVLPENDNAPFFEESVYFINITDNNRDVPRQIGQIQARDRDRDTGASLTYSLLSVTQYFTVQNGQLLLLKIPPASENVFVLKVSASDGDFAANTTLAVVQEVTCTSSDAQETSSHDKIALTSVFAAVLIFMAALLLVSWMFICCLLHRHSKRKQYISSVCKSTRGRTTVPNESFSHYEPSVAVPSVNCLAYNTAPYRNDPAFDGAKDTLRKEPEYEVLLCDQQNQPKKADPAQPYALPQKQKLAPQNSVDCYVKMESVVDSLTSADASSANDAGTLAQDSCDGHRNTTGQEKVAMRMMKLESSLEFGGAMETSLEFGATRGTSSLDFGGSSPNAVSPRGDKGKGFEGCGGHELLVCHELQEREEECPVSFVGGTKWTGGNPTNEQTH